MFAPIFFIFILNIVAFLFVYYMGVGSAYVELYNCYNEETAEDLIKYFTKLPKNVNRDNEFLLSYLYLKEGNFKTAKKINSDIIAKYPNSSQSIRAKLDNVSIALYNEDNLNEAVSLFEDAAVKQNLSTPFELSLAQENILSYAKSRGVETLSLLQNSAALKKEFISKVPEEYSLLGNYPNPFNPSTAISYNLPYQSDVEIIIYDIMGRRIRGLNISAQMPGNQNTLWDGRNENGSLVSSGVYIYRIIITSLENNEIFEKTAKLMILK